MLTAIRSPWPAAPVWPAPASNFSGGRAVAMPMPESRRIDPPAPRPAPKPAPKPAPRPAAPERHVAAADNSEDVFGVAAVFGVWTSPVNLTGELYEKSGFDRAVMMIMPGAFDRSLSLCGAGDVKFAVNFEFAHDDSTKVCSTISGALRVFADREKLFFYIRGNCNSDAREAVRRARWHSRNAGYREVSIGQAPIRFRTARGTAGEPNRIFVDEARLCEISHVRRGACPGTCLTFL